MNPLWWKKIGRIVIGRIRYAVPGYKQAGQVTGGASYSPVRMADCVVLNRDVTAATSVDVDSGWAVVDRIALNRNVRDAAAGKRNSSRALDVRVFIR